MTAKELRSAAERTLNYDESSDADIDTLAQYILSTVRDDDDELVTGDWLIEIIPGEPDFDDDCFMVGFDISICQLGDTEKYCWEVWCHEYELGAVKTRGQFRSLCKGLGIVLEEKTNAE